MPGPVGEGRPQSEPGAGGARPRTSSEALLGGSGSSKPSADVPPDARPPDPGRDRRSASPQHFHEAAQHCAWPLSPAEPRGLPNPTHGLRCSRRPALLPSYLAFGASSRDFPRDKGLRPGPGYGHAPALITVGRDVTMCHRWALGSSLLPQETLRLGALWLLSSAAVPGPSNHPPPPGHSPKPGSAWNTHF